MDGNSLSDLNGAKLGIRHSNGKATDEYKNAREEFNVPVQPAGDIYRKIEAEIPRLRRYAHALTKNAVAADDLLQECLVRGLEKQHLWKESTNLRAWLFTIMHNQYVNKVRRDVREGTAVDISETIPNLVHIAEQGIRLELRDVDRALAKLPEEQRTAILLVGIEGMDYKAVAEITGVPVGTVRSRLSRGRETLNKMLEGGKERRKYSRADSNDSAITGIRERLRELDRAALRVRPALHHPSM